MLSSRVFLMLFGLIHLEVILAKGVKCGSSFIPLQMVTQSFQHHSLTQLISFINLKLPLHNTQNCYRNFSSQLNGKLHFFFFTPRLWLFKRLKSCTVPSVGYPNKSFSSPHEFVITKLISVSSFECTAHNLQIL